MGIGVCYIKVLNCLWGNQTSFGLREQGDEGSLEGSGLMGFRVHKVTRSSELKNHNLLLRK